MSNLYFTVKDREYWIIEDIVSKQVGYSEKSNYRTSNDIYEEYGIHFSNRYGELVVSIPEDMFSLMILRNSKD